MCTRKINEKKNVQFKELVEMSFILLLHFFLYFLSVLLPCLIMSSYSKSKSKSYFFNIWIQILTLLETQ